tara:strand:- start:10303 stop:10668 length:366 start_codon:yes stop_codon:yes gene_type:complete
MTIFGFTCSSCGNHEAGDFTERVIVKVGNKYKRGRYNPYESIPHPLLRGSKLYIPKIELETGETAYPEEFKKYFSCWGVNESVDLVATEIYCNGMLDGGGNDRFLSQHRCCFPKLVNLSKA